MICPECQEEDYRIEYEGQVCPECIDQLTEDGVSFTNCFVSIARTFPTWVSNFTGQRPSRHKICHMFPTKETRDNPLFPLLPKILTENGYSTHIIADFAGDIFSRMDFGFQHTDTPEFNFPVLIKQRSLEIHPLLFPYITNCLGRKIFPVLEEFVNNPDPKYKSISTRKLLRRLRKEKKFFISLFLSATHFPYCPQYPYYRSFTSKDYSGDHKYQKANLLGNEAVNKDDIEQINALYDGGVKSFDNEVKKIIDCLKSTGLV